MYFIDNEWFSAEDEAREEEFGISLGDARRCPHHPHVKTSSDDGMFDAPCDECEGQMAEYAAEKEFERTGGNCANPWGLLECYPTQAVYEKDMAKIAEEDSIPF